MHWVWLSLSSPILCYRATVRIPVSVFSLERKFHINIACHGLQSITLVFIFLRPYYINLYVTFFFICLIIGVLLARGRRDHYSVEDDTLPRRRGSLSDFIYDDSITCFVLFTYGLHIYQISSIGCGPDASLSFPQPKQNKNGVAFRSVFGHVFSGRKSMTTSRVAVERSIDGRPRRVVG